VLPVVESEGREEISLEGALNATAPPGEAEAEGEGEGENDQEALDLGAAMATDLHQDPQYVQVRRLGKHSDVIIATPTRATGGFLRA
jgi:hypothetical protein